MSELPTTAVTVGLAEAPRRGRGTATFVLRTLGGGLVSVGLIVVLGFFLFRVLPGDPVRTMTRDRPGNPEQLARLRAEYGLDRPLPAQFVDYLADLARGDLGTSYVYSRPVTEIILNRLGPTVLLTGSALVVSVALGLWLGSRAAWRHGSVFDRLATGTALVLWSVPTFWLGLIALMVFAVGLDLFPTGGMTSPGGVDGFLPAVLDVAHHLVLPCLTMVAVVYAQYLMVMRSSLLEEMSADYLTTARAKGLREDLVRRRHAVPNALLPTITIIFLHVGLVVAGAVTVETVFSWPGLGRLLIDSVSFRDYPVIQAEILLFSLEFILINLIVDVLYALVNPEIRYQ